jgi:large subunit ribosomal protein L15
MDLSNLKPAPGSVRERKRVGRGPGSGQGKTAGRGHKGRKSRSGGNSPPGYEGGQVPLQRRLPKRGFRNPFRTVFAVVNVRDLAGFDAGSVVDVAALRARGLVKGKRPVKVLGDGALDRALTVRVQAFSAHAKEQIAAAGGNAEVVEHA